MKHKYLGSHLLSLSVITIALFVYLPTMAPTITWQHGGADSGELAAAVVTNGVAHPPGYPTYLLLGSFWLMLPLAKDPAYQLNLLSVVSTALAGAFTAQTIVLLSESLPERLRYGGALFGSLSLLFTPLVWSQALITEVYALGLLMLSAVTYFLLAWHKKQAASSSSGRFYLILASLLFGLGLGVLPQLVLILPGAMGVYLSAVRKSSNDFRRKMANRQRSMLVADSGKNRANSGQNRPVLSQVSTKRYFFERSPSSSFSRSAVTTLPNLFLKVAKEVCGSGLAVALGLSTYFLLPWRAALQPRANWGDPVTLERFWQLVTASQYHHLAQRLTPEAWLSRFGDGLILVGQNLGWVSLIIGLWALGILWYNNRVVLGYLVSLILLTLCFRTSYSAIGNQVYLIPALYGLSILIGLGFASLFTLLQAKSARIALALSLLMMMDLIWQGVNLMPQMDISHEYDAALFAQRTFDSLPHNTIIVTERDEYTFPLWYYQSLGQRLDIVVIDSRLLFYNWYREHLIHHYPDLNPSAVRPGGLTALERPLYHVTGELEDDKMMEIK